MSTGVQKASITGQATSEALSLLDGTIPAMIMGQSPLPEILDALCADIEKHYSGMVCSVVLLDADGVTLRKRGCPQSPTRI
jgi:hypothetical protein